MRRKISSSWKFALAMAVAVPVAAGMTTLPMNQVAFGQEAKQGSESKSRLARLSHDVEFMASDELGGRDTYSPGAEKTIEYIVSEFKKYGVKSAVPDGSYRQPFEVNMGQAALNPNSASLVFSAGDKNLPLTLKKNFCPQFVGGTADVSADLVFVGYGIDDAENGVEDYDGVDVEGKVVVMFRRQPKLSEGAFSEAKPVRSAFINSKIRSAKKHKAAGIVFVNDVTSVSNPEEDRAANEKAFGGREGKFPFVHITQSALNQLLAASPLKGKNGKLTNIADVAKAINDGQKLSQDMGASVEYRAKFERPKGWGYNVCGVIEGEGPLAHQTVVIGGHYDHLGVGKFGSRTRDRMGEIHNGADDNATGTAAVIELARRFAESGKKPARRLVFIAFSGEERGLLGSNFYCQKPIYPLESTVAMINFDMIGWLRKDRLTLFGTGTSADWVACAEKANKNTKLVLNNTHSPFAGSDHMPFYQKKVACVFAHTGLTPTYHTPDDDYKTLDMEGASRVVDFTEALIKEVNKVEGFKFQSPTRNRPARNRAYLGARFDYENIKDNGVLVLECEESTPAGEAGLKKGDILDKVDGKEIRSRDDIVKMMRGKKPSDKINAEVHRAGKIEKILIILGKRPSRR